MQNLVRVAAVLLIVGCWPRLTTAASLTLAWDPPTDWIPAGYILFAGTTPGEYLYQFDIGDTTLITLNPVPEGGPYYFAVAAYDADGNISHLSNEIVASVPASPPKTVTGVELTPSLPSPQVVGRAVSWLANTTGGVPPYQYQWAVYELGRWTVGPWTSSSSLSWTPSTNGEHRIRVRVRSAGSTSIRGDQVQSVFFTVKASSPAAR